MGLCIGPGWWYVAVHDAVSGGWNLSGLRPGAELLTSCCCNLSDTAQICGAVCSLRQKHDRVAVWTKDAQDSDAYEVIGRWTHLVENALENDCSHQTVPWCPLARFLYSMHMYTCADCGVNSFRKWKDYQRERLRISGEQPCLLLQSSLNGIPQPHDESLKKLMGTRKRWAWTLPCCLYQILKMFSWGKGRRLLGLYFTVLLCLLRHVVNVSRRQTSQWYTRW